MAGLGLFMRRRGLATHPAMVDLLKDTLIGAYSFAGKSNDDADWNIVKDMSGKGADLEILDATNGVKDSVAGMSSGYQSDGSYFKGNGSGNGYCRVAIPTLSDFTIILKRNAWTSDQWKTFLGTDNAEGGSSIYIDYREANNTFSPHYARTNTHTLYSKEVKNATLIWMTPTHFNGIAMDEAPTINPPAEGYMYIGKIRGNQAATTRWQIYSLYIFNQSLPHELIEQFIQENIDESYVLPQ